jgi:beta-fructofuranosidase
MQNTITLSTELTVRHNLRNDPQRPQYHFLPPANWMNDPNGVVQWQGRYHLFYQYNPVGPIFGKMHWGHAVSDDLVHWEDLPLALAPEIGTVDEDGCWSGCFVNNNGQPTLIYTVIRDNKTQRTCIATGSDDLVHWQKFAGNPIIDKPPAGLDVIGFRDHSVWREDETWYQVIGSGWASGGGTALLFASDDLYNWRYLHPLANGDSTRNPEVWECPDFFPLGDRHVLLISSTNSKHNDYLTGHYDTEKHVFTPELQARLDLGGSMYAAQTFKDEQGRRILWGWLREARPKEEMQAATWSGAMALPLILDMLPDGKIGISFPPEMQKLRRDEFTLPVQPLEPDNPLNIPTGERGDCLEMELEVELGEAAEVGMILRASPDGTEQTVLTYNAASQILTVDRSSSSLNPIVKKDEVQGQCPLENGQPLNLHIYIDRSIVELNINGTQYMAFRVYPTRPDSQGLALFSRGGTARLKSFSGWQLHSIWE